ncbi:MAG TPA: tetratricopeptide repeat protein [Campylobacterales bacterium]|jgi:Ca-activated chloride channel family protein|nr:tetratricopeptide repeat protein [Campylobacterales bacterium]
MKKVLISLTLLTIFSEASLLDFSYLDKAKEAYSKKDYAKAYELYSKVDSGEARFNQADALYRQKKYKEALSEYQSISDKNLEFKKLHNIGNCYANLNNIDEAIKSYEDALKIKEDKDTRFNLELLKKKKKKQEKKNKKDDKKNQDQKKNDKNNKDNKSDKKKEENQKDKKSQEDKKKNQENKKKSQEAKKKKEEEQKKQVQMAKQDKKQPPITDMEERKWQKMLNKKGVNTLMLPLNNKEHKRDETNPW